MRIRILLSVFLFTGLFCSSVWGQGSSVSVDQFTGTAHINIPLTSISSGMITVPVGLNYVARGVKVRDVEGSAGIGWYLTAGGQVSRELRGLPDDVSRDEQAANRYGWLNVQTQAVDLFNLKNYSSGASCSDQADDISYINTYLGSLFDYEPDVFSINAPGLSCSFVFDKDRQVRIFSKEDVRISKTVDPVTGKILSFVAVNDKGMKYEFNERDVVTKWTGGANPGGIGFFKRDYELYKGTIEYTNTWYLTRITDPVGKQMTLSYGNDHFEGGSSMLKLYIPSSGTTALLTPQFETNEYRRVKDLLNISNGLNTVSFATIANTYTNKKIYSQVSWDGVTCNLRYLGMRYNNNGEDYNRFFLNSVDFLDSQTGASFSTFDLNYIGQSGYGFSTVLPDSASNKVDYWGYFNNSSAVNSMPEVRINPSNASLPAYMNAYDSYSRTDYSISLTGNARLVNPATVMAASLAKISYDNGGSTSFEYESNDFYDPTAGAVAQGGGIRIKSITEFDGSDPSKNRVRSFSYLDPQTGISSGKPLTMPVFAFLRPYTASGTLGEKWNYATIRSEYDLSEENHSILYSAVSESISGMGKTLREFASPATYFSGVLADWAPSVNSLAVTGCDLGLARNATPYDYPFAPDANYDFERGTLSKSTLFNSAGNKVGETVYSYQRSGQPFVVTGLKYSDDGNPGMKRYAKYLINTGVEKRLVNEQSSVFNPQGNVLSGQQNKSYFYESVNHGLLTREEGTNSDGVINRTLYKYTKDYSASASADSAIHAIYNLQQQNINVPVETVVQTVENGNVKTIGASLIRFRQFEVGNGKSLYLPARNFTFLSTEGITDFQPSSAGSGFTQDARYNLNGYTTVYDYFGMPQSSYNSSRAVQTTIADRISGKPLASFSHAAIGEIAYSSFSGEYDNAAFSISGGASTTSTDTRAGVGALSFSPGTVLSKQVHRNPAAESYVFSCWIKSAQSGQLNLSFSGAAQSLSFSNTGGIWVYKEIKVPLAGVPADFTLSVQTTAGLLVDDILFYPAHATVATNEYDAAGQYVLAQTGSNGITSYYQYDAIGRILLGLDQDKNIVLRKSYVRNGYIPTSLPPTAFAVSAVNNPVNTQVGFVAANSYTGFQNVSYHWDFGDGTTGSGRNVQHSYAAAGNYTVTLTVSATGFPSLGSSQQINVSAPPANIYVVSFAGQGGADFTSVQLYQNGQLVYTFTGTDVNSISIPKGIYDVSVSITGQHYDPFSDTGYESIRTWVNNLETCMPYARNGNYYFSGINLNTSDLQITAHTEICQ